jgi:predicted RNase H-like HicB family nuclease
MKFMKFQAIIEKSQRNYSAYVPDLPGCIATGRTLREVKRNLRQAIDFHINGIKQSRLPHDLSALDQLAGKIDLDFGAIEDMRQRRFQGPAA